MTHGDPHSPPSERIEALRATRRRLHHQVRRAEALRGRAAVAGLRELARTLEDIAERSALLRKRVAEAIRDEGIEPLSLDELEPADHERWTPATSSDLVEPMAALLESNRAMTLGAEKSGDWTLEQRELLREIRLVSREALDALNDAS
jgi:hypothetical protein